MGLSGDALPNPKILLAFVVLIAALTLLAAQCRKVPDPVLPTDTDSCHAACAHVRAAGCEIGNDTGEGMPCEIWCVETHNAGMPLRPSCWLSIPPAELTPPLCDEIEARCFGH